MGLRLKVCKMSEHCPKCKSLRIVSFEGSNMEMVNDESNYEAYDYDVIEEQQFPFTEILLCLECLEAFTK